MDLSHTEPIYDFAWLQSKTGSEVMTVSSDGLVLWWDIRMFGEYTAKLAADKSQEIIESLPIKEKGAEHCQVFATSESYIMSGRAVVCARLSDIIHDSALLWASQLVACFKTSFGVLNMQTLQISCCWGEGASCTGFVQPLVVLECISDFKARRFCDPKPRYPSAHIFYCCRVACALLTIQQQVQPSSW